MADTSFIRPDELWRSVGLRADQTVVHLGCGAGFYLIPAAKIVGKHGQAIGVDILSNMLEEAEGRARHSNVAEIVHTIRANLENERGSTLADDSADWVLVANILHQSQPDKIIAEAARIVRPAGSVVIVEWDTAASPLGPPAASRVAKADVVQATEKAGLVMARTFTPSPYHYGLVLHLAAEQK